MYLGFGHYGATHGSKWIRSQPDTDGWFTLVMAHGHQGTRQFLTAMSTKCTIISGMYTPLQNVWHGSKSVVTFGLIKILSHPC